MRNRTRRFRPTLEGLENRELMAVDFNPATGVLNVTGTDRDDVVTVRIVERR